MEMWQNGKKLIRIANREEDGWELVKCYFSDNFTPESDDEKQLLKGIIKQCTHTHSPPPTTTPPHTLKI